LLPKKDAATVNKSPISTKKSPLSSAGSKKPHVPVKESPSSLTGSKKATFPGIKFPTTAVSANQAAAKRTLSAGVGTEISVGVSNCGVGRENFCWWNKDYV
jgi:hypothetical protein